MAVRATASKESLCGKKLRSSIGSGKEAFSATAKYPKYLVDFLTQLLPNMDSY